MQWASKSQIIVVLANVQPSITTIVQVVPGGQGFEHFGSSLISSSPAKVADGVTGEASSVIDADVPGEDEPVLELSRYSKVVLLPGVCGVDGDGDDSVAGRDSRDVGGSKVVSLVDVNCDVVPAPDVNEVATADVAADVKSLPTLENEDAPSELANASVFSVVITVDDDAAVVVLAVVDDELATGNVTGKAGKLFVGLCWGKRVGPGGGGKKGRVLLLPDGLGVGAVVTNPPAPKQRGSGEQ